MVLVVLVVLVVVLVVVFRTDRSSGEPLLLPVFKNPPPGPPKPPPGPPKPPPGPALPPPGPPPGGPGCNGGGPGGGSAGPGGGGELTACRYLPKSLLTGLPVTYSCRYLGTTRIRRQ